MTQDDYAIALRQARHLQTLEWNNALDSGGMFDMDLGDIDGRADPFPNLITILH